MENKQTLVEWLFDKLEKQGDAWINASIGRMQISIKEEDYINLFEQAKKMFEEQLKDAYNQGYRDGNYDASNIPLSIGDISEYINAEKYYNETYGK